MLYSIQVGAEGPVKLGTSADPLARLRTLQTSHYLRLHLRAVWQGDRTDEQALHDRFADARLHGEWFTCTPELQELLLRHATSPPVVPAAASSGAKRRTRRAQAPRRPIPAGHPGVDAAPTPDHPTWRDFVMLGPGERRDADKWVAALCDLAPSLTARHLLTYLELVAGADETGCLRVDFDCLCERVTGSPDRALCAQLVSDLVALVLPERDAPYSSAMSAHVLSDLAIYMDEPERLAINAVDAMVRTGSARVRMVRCGAGFGARAVPVDFRLCADLEARDGWANEQLEAAARRSPTRHQRHVAA